MSHTSAKELLKSVQETAWRNTAGGLYVPRVEGDVRNSNWPTCQTCHRDVDSVELKNQNSWSVELWAHCHGKEDYYTIKFPFRLEEGTGDEMRQANIMAAMRTFSPFGNPEL